VVGIRKAGTLFLRKAKQGVEDAKRTINSSAVISAVAIFLAFVALIVAVTR
jgi:hypothetical protein